MFTNRKQHEFLGKEYVWLWAALAFQAGYANAGGFMATARFVSHMTGFGTNIGVSLSKLDYRLAFEMCSAPLTFILGAMASAMVIDRPMLKKQPPNYLAVMTALVAIFTFVTIGGIENLFGLFGEPLLLERDFALMALLCFACGMQNACFTSVTRGQIRTTHLTGISTDIGITFVKVFFMDPQHRQTKLAKRINYIRILTFVSFSFGSMVSAIVFAKVGYFGFGFLVLSSSLLLIVVTYKQAAIERRRLYLAGQTSPQAVQAR